MAAATNNKGDLPEGFVSPFKRVAQEDRFDDALASVAILTGKSLADVRKLAEQLGLPKTGPYWVDNDMVAKLLMNLGSLVASNYKEFASIDALPDVAILLVDYDETTEVGRHVVWHHIRGTKTQQAFHYVVPDRKPLFVSKVACPNIERRPFSLRSHRPNGQGFDFPERKRQSDHFCDERHPWFLKSAS